LVSESRHVEQVFQRKSKHEKRCLFGIAMSTQVSSTENSEYLSTASTKEEKIVNQGIFESVFKEQWG